VPPHSRAATFLVAHKSLVFEPPTFSELELLLESYNHSLLQQHPISTTIIPTNPRTL
jgi:hypothetical protein